MKKRSTEKYSDDELVEMIAQGHSKRDVALSLITQWHEVRHNISKTVISNSGQMTDAEDMYIEAIVLLDQKIRNGKFKLTGSLKGYIVGCAWHLWRNELKKRKKITYVEERMQFEKMLPQMIEEDFEDRDKKRDKLGAALKKLEIKCQKILKYWNLNYPMEEIAEIMDLSSARMASKVKYQCLKKLNSFFN